MMLPSLTTFLLVAAAASVEVRPPEAKPGDALLVVVAGATVEPRGALAGRPLRFWRAGDGWRAIAALPAETPVGPLVASVHAGAEALVATVKVVDPAFPSRTLTLPPKFVEAPASEKARIAADQRAFVAALGQPFAPPRFELPFVRPLVGETTGGYGDRRTYNGKLQGQHYGLDLDAATGTPVLAANDGEVVMARDNYYAGTTVLLWHGADLYTAYFHLSRVDVKVGQVVARSAALGLSGASGRVTGPHLHWGIKASGLWVDPDSVIRLGEFGK
jgi:murein DD-endopeptidase MepM/ murein hydrolase activator NlpD